MDTTSSLSLAETGSLPKASADGSDQPRQPAFLHDRSASQPALASLLQKRLGIVAAIWALVWISVLGIACLTFDGDRELASRLVYLRLPFVAAGVLLNVLVLLALRRRPYSEAMLRRGEVAFFLLNVTLYVVLPAYAYGNDANPVPISVILLMRCIFIPDRPGRTLLVCLAMWGLYLLSCLAPAVLPNGAPAELLTLQVRRILFITGQVTLAVHIAVGLAAVHIIHGLRMHAFRAEQAGSYRLQEKLGAGGMGEVYRARHALLRRPTAVKMLRPELAGSAVALCRFEREVRAVSELTDPHTIAVYDFGQTESGRFYYAMEYLDGLDLQKLVERYGALEPRRMVFIVGQILSSLGEAHWRGLLHRDIKPSNVYLTVRGCQYDFAKVLDFGLVKEMEQDPLQTIELSIDGPTLAGSPLYMAPERFYGSEQVDHRSDLYAVGAVAYFLVAGRPVFETRNPVEALLHHVRTLPTPPRNLGLQISAGLEAVILRALEKEPGKRFASAEAFAEALRRTPEWGSWTQEEARAWWAIHLPRAEQPAGHPMGLDFGIELEPAVEVAL